jgi:hypothetical protein
MPPPLARRAAAHPGVTAPRPAPATPAPSPLRPGRDLELHTTAVAAAHPATLLNNAHGVVARGSPPRYRPGGGRRRLRRARADLLAVVRESLTNVSRHAHASQVQLHLSVDDDGGVSGGHRQRPWHPSTGPRSGITNMRARAERLNGSMDIGQTATGGTYVTARGRRTSRPAGAYACAARTRHCRTVPPSRRRLTANSPPTSLARSRMFCRPYPPEV